VSSTVLARRAASAHPDGIAARERDGAACDCSGNGVSLSTVNRAHMAYDHDGIMALKPEPSGGRQAVREEKALLARFAKAAGAGEMLNIHDLRQSPCFSRARNLRR
jgi:hypothetical protein